ncbi:hypothetical protein FJT64_014947 [Amphibalanus amphitrite]|uniref:Apple domain-containing protein n=1 Tax=Amphibalanus amphitrite TaxID=1232801 RepID=A0A6A4XE15_AMPAM|nr:hypothetical protein FJT64_014947 [Amphibalanus amphitrite]
MKLFVCVWIIGYMFEVARACLDIPEYYGGLDSSLVIGASTLASPASSCNCCGLCHQDTACRSFSFRTDTGECTLYSRVGGYGEFQRQPAGSQVTQFFFMPSSSGSDEFCRSDSDCVTPGDACRGRICTSEPTVTCRRAWERNGALPDHRYFGYLDGQEHRLYCRMQGQYSGATLLLASHNVPTDGVAWSADNVLYKLHPRDGYPSEAIDYSILR